MQSGSGRIFPASAEPRTRGEAMRIEHVAVWTNDLERLRAFYERHFDARAGARYDSSRHPGFSSYFLRFDDSDTRLELMSLGSLPDGSEQPALGYPHIAIGVGSRAAVDALTARLAAAGIRVVTEPHETGDGYYEAVVCDPDGNLVEIVA